MCYSIGKIDLCMSILIEVWNTLTTASETLYSSTESHSSVCVIDLYTKNIMSQKDQLCVHAGFLREDYI